MKLAHVLGTAFVTGLLALACGSSGESGPIEDDADFTGSKLSVNEQKSAKLDESGICRTTCRSVDNGRFLDDCREGLFADPAFCSQDDNECRKVKMDEAGLCRHPDGKFTVGLCCTSMCAHARLTKDHAASQYHCRSTDGTFLSAGCCNKQASGIPVKSVAAD
jgi:hypothetical protein